MSIKERQQKEKNHITLVLGIIIIGYSTILALLGFVDKTADLSIAIPRAIVSVIIFIAFILCYFKFKICICISTAINSRQMFFFI